MSFFDNHCEQHKHHLVESRCPICFLDDDNLVDSKAEYDALKIQNPSAVAAMDEHMKRVNSVVVCPNGHIFDNRCIDEWEKRCITESRTPNCPTCRRKLLDIHLRKPVYAPPDYRAPSPQGLFNRPHNVPFDVNMPPTQAMYYHQNDKVSPSSPTPPPQVKSKHSCVMS